MLAAGLALVAAACETPSSRFSPVAPLGRTAAAPAAEAPAPDAAAVQAAQERPRGAAEVAEAFRLEGQGAFVNPRRAPLRRAAETRDGVELAFEDAPVAEVVSALIGDVLGQDFVIDPQVSGRISLRSARPVPRDDLPAALDRALRSAGARLTETAEGVWLVAPEGRGQGFARGPRLPGEALAPGHGYVIAPLRHVSAREMERLLRPFAPPDGVALADAERDVLVLAGDPSQLEAMLETVALFDADWLAGMSFGFYPLQAAEPATLAAELAAVLGGEGGPAGGQIRFVPLPRLNAIVAVARRPHRLEQAESWIRRLDVRADRGRRARLAPLASADAERVAERLERLFAREGGEGAGRIAIEADADANALIVVSDEEGYRQVLELVRQLDRPARQVLIEVMIVEVVLSDELRYGVQWFLDTRDGGRTTWTDNPGGGVGPRAPGFSYTYASDYVRAALNAIASVTDVEVVSSPQIMTLDNQTASLQVGDQVPVITQTAVSVTDPNAPIVNSVQFRDTGVVLNVTPRIGPDGAVLLRVAQEVSSVAETTTSGIDSPTIQQRRFESTVSVRDGQTVALGGLIRASRTTNRSGVPGLRRAPLVGALFRDSVDSVRRTELIIFLTPRVLASAEDAAAATRDMRERLEALRLSGFGDD